MNPRKSPRILLPPKAVPSGAPNIAVLVDTATSWGRGIIEGIGDYGRRHGGWNFYFEPWGREEHFRLPRGWRGDGIIARIATPALALRLRRTGLPVVDISSVQYPSSPSFPRVCNDVEAAAAVAADYFLARGFRHFAYLGVRGLEFVARQSDAFLKILRARGMECAVHGLRGQGQSPAWNINLDELARWLRTLPKPVALFAWTGGMEAVRACQRAGLRVPEEVAVLAGSDDELLCRVSRPTVSGIPAASHRIGGEAARLMHRLMQGRPAPKQPLEIPPLAVITRESTDTLAIADPALATAVAFIRQNLGNPIQVPDIAAHAGLCRSGLERRFASALGNSPAAYLLALRLDRSKCLLAEGGLSVAEVAAQTGFGSPEYMTYVFRNRWKTTPLRYRNETRGV